MTETYGIADLAREFDVTTRTIRFYEDRGLIQPRREGQRRIYVNRDRVRLHLIMRGKRLGFSLDEIHEMIDLYDQDQSEVPQLRLFLEKIRERRQQLHQQLRDVEVILGELDTFEARTLELLTAKGAGESPPRNDADSRSQR
ncbi:MAG: MerR family transcriptional regulator [Rhodospirillales bacterium]